MNMWLEYHDMHLTQNDPFCCARGGPLPQS